MQYIPFNLTALSNIFEMSMCVNRSYYYYL